MISEARPTRLKANFIYLTLGQGYNQAVTMLSGLLVVRLLGPLEYGHYTLAVVGLNLGSIISDVGLSSYLNRESARLNSSEAYAMWRQAAILRLAFSLPVLLVLVSLTLLFPALGQPELTALAGLSLFPMAISALTNAFLNGQGRILLNVLLNSLGITLGLILIVGLVYWQPYSGTVLLAGLLASMVTVALLLYPVVANRPTETTQGLEARQLLAASRSFLYIGLASLVFQYADIYLVSMLLGSQQVGTYGAALRLLALVTTIPTVWGIAAVPRFARQPYHFQQELIRWGWGLAAAGVGLALVGLIASPILVTFILGSRYEETGRILAILLWAGAGIFACAAPVTWLTITNRQHLVLPALIIAGVGGLAITVLLTGAFKWGLEGVALARVCATWGLCGLYIFFGKSALSE